MLELKRRPTWDRTAHVAFDGSEIPSKSHSFQQPLPGGILATHWLRPVDNRPVARKILHPVYDRESRTA